MSDNGEGRRVLGFLVLRALAVLGVLLLGEIVLRLTGYAVRYPPLYHTYSETRLLLPARSANGRETWRTNPEYLEEFAPCEFPRKRGGVFRVFCLGGSVARGWNLTTGTESDFLSRLLPGLGRRAEGINTSGFGWGSFRNALLCAEILRLDPSLLVVLVGDNEFWEYPIYRAMAAGPFPMKWLLVPLEHSRLFLAGHDLSWRTRAGEGSGYAELDDAALACLLDRFELNIRSIIAQCRKAKIPVVFGTLPANLLVEPDTPTDWLADASRHSPNLSPRQLSGWKEAMREGRERGARRDWHGALASFRRAAELDPAYAREWREIGRCLLKLGRPREAREPLWKHIDLSRRLVTRDLNDAVRRVCREEGIPFADCAAAVERAAPHGLPGYDLFIDSMHLNRAGHAILAETFRKTIETRILAR